MIFLIFTLTSIAQDKKAEARLYLEEAERIYKNSSAYIQARDAYLKVLDYDPENLRANFMAGLLFLNHVNKEQATQYFLKVHSLDPEYSFKLLYLIGRSYQYAMDFDNAIKYFDLYRIKLRSNPEYSGEDLVSLPEVLMRVRESERAKELVSHPLNYNITNAGSAINSEWPDYGPSTDAEGTMMIFTTRRAEDNTNEKLAEDKFPYEDIFISYKRIEKWTLAQNIGPGINRLYNESGLTLSKDGKQLYIYFDEYAGDIYVSNRANDGSWQNPEPLEGSVNTRDKETSVTISPDGSVIFFVSDRPGTLGGLDIFYSIRSRRGIWQDVKNIGPVINTASDEDFPFIDYDGKTLYFSSKGHNGMGGFDIYKTVYDSASETWVNPLNIGYPINTPDNDIAFISTRDGRTGYFSSVREGGSGYEDIYMFIIPEVIRRMEDPVKTIISEPALIPVRVYISVKEENGDPIDAVVRIRNDSENYARMISRINTGIYMTTSVLRVSSEYTVSAEKDGYMFANEKLMIPASSASEQNVDMALMLKKIQAGSSMVLRNIYFDFDKATLRPESFFEINKLYQMLTENSRLIAEIAGFTDNTGSLVYNYRLSYNRAKTVVDYLVKKGLDPAKIKAAGYGEGKPIASNDNEKDGRELNRRVEFKILRYPE
ncbi:MAG TPA: OmpA family protein [Cyclobacteriaceae bacterium]|nr:OmpA family protein [Cyclobacteriaceae bacterium]